ncbi:DUF6328 family protein [Streptomyces scopuliridis]|uniref:DUF6328 family protein n=1 Tax=Streptomyces scopuliridis TaxID=452529 RepID=UPI003433CB15
MTGQDADGHGHGRHETVEERADRLWGELLQELRVAQTGVQILFGFLLTVVFQARFTELSDADRVIYTVTVMLGAAAVGALIGPVSFHRLLTGLRLKPRLVVWASRLTVVGLVLLFCTMASALLLILRLAVGHTLALWLVGVVAVWFVLCWGVFPELARHAVRAKSGADGPGDGRGGGRTDA